MLAYQEGLCSVDLVSTWYVQYIGQVTHSFPVLTINSETVIEWIPRAITFFNIFWQFLRVWREN